MNIREYAKSEILPNIGDGRCLSRKYLQKRHPEFFEKIKQLDFYNDKIKTTEILYKLIYEDIDNICIIVDCCNKTNFISLQKGYLKCCSYNCNAKLGKITKFEKYGNENYNNTIQMLETKIENNSYDNMIQKYKKTCLEKYGVDHYWKTKECRDKIINTTILNYGVDNPMKSSIITDKVKETNLERYGFENVSFNQEVKDKIRNAQLNLNDEEKKVKEMKRQETCFIKYGVSHQMQTGLYTNSGYKWKEYILPNNETIKIQGYENKLLDELLQEYTEDEIITERRLMPEFWYTGIDGNNHRYFPDMFIPKTNTIYEVKSKWTMNVNLETNNLKFQAVKDSGYNFELRVY